MDRALLFDALSHLSSQDFERLLVSVNMPRMNRAGASAKIGEQVSALLEWADSAIGPGVEAIARHLAELNCFEFNAYLRSLVATYEKWWEHYTLTDAVGKVEPLTLEKPSAFDFGLMVQTVTQEREPTALENIPLQQDKEKTERLPVLEGIRKYADDHVLLVGRPGSGKSTALIRLLLEEAAFSPGPSPKLGRGGQERIPVLVELRYWQTSVLERIRAFLCQHDPHLNLDDAALNALLRQGRFLLLIDGLNELPSDEARTQLTTFRRDHPKVPMIFTTRDLGLGGNLGIEKKLEMQPLTEAQMKSFIRAYVPDQAEAMLRQLSDRLREFGQTPLLLWMLCEVFQQSPNRQMPTNLAEVFRAFTTMYEDSSVRKHEVALLKGDVRPLSDRRLWKDALIALAALMMQGETPVDFRAAIHRTEAERELGKRFANEKFPVRDILDDLLKYHLLQNRTTDQLEFRHQLIQEHYAAEHLLDILPELSDEQLKRDYLNLLKWAEAIALMLALVDDEAQALRVVKLAVDVDWMLAARLASSLGLENQGYIIKHIDKSNLPLRFKIKLFGLTGNSNIIPTLMTYADHNSSDIRETVAQALGTIECNQSVFALERLVLNEKNIFSLFAIVSALENIGNEIAISVLHKALTRENPSIRGRVTQALVNLQDRTVFRDLLDDLKDNDPNTRERAVVLLGEIGSSQSIPNLIESLSDPHSEVKWKAALALGDLGSEAAIPALVNAIYSSDNKTHRYSICKALGKIKSEIAVDALFEVLQKGDAFDFIEAARALAILQKKAVIPYLIRVLKRKNFSLLGISEVFEEFSGSQAQGAVHELALILRSSNYCVLSRYEAAKSLGKIGCDNNEIVSLLIEMSKNKEKLIREASIEALGHIGSGICVTAMREALQDEDYSVRFQAMSGLSKINEFTSQTLVSLIQCLENYEYYKDLDIWRYDDEWSWMAAEVLENLDGSILPSLQKSVFHNASANTPHFDPLMYVIEKVQSRCKYYKHEIYQAGLADQQGDNTPSQSDKIIASTITIQTVEKLTVMSDKAPIFNQQNATIGVNYAAEGSQQDFTQHIYAPEQNFEILLTGYKHFIDELQQQNSHVTDEIAIIQTIDIEARRIDTRWQNFLNLKRLWNGGKKAAIKVGEHFVESNPWGKGAIAFLEGVSEDVK